MVELTNAALLLLIVLSFSFGWLLHLAFTSKKVKPCPDLSEIRKEVALELGALQSQLKESAEYIDNLFEGVEDE